jgi:hypothetical protein
MGKEEETVSDTRWGTRKGGGQERREQASEKAEIEERTGLDWTENGGHAVNST